MESKSAEALGGNLLAQLKKRKLSQKGKPGKPSGRKALRKANKLCKMPERLLASDPRVEDIEARELERQKTLVLIIYKFGHRT